MEYGEKTLFHIPSLRVHTGDKIGIIGTNGAGKTTLLNLIAQRIQPLSGHIALYDDFRYIEQLDCSDQTIVDTRQYYKWQVTSAPHSGGEIMRHKIAQALSQRAGILLCDEPTSNLDQSGIELLERTLQSYKGSLLLVTHDRKLMDRVCNQIWEIDQGSLRVFDGNYSDFIQQKAVERAHQQKEYEKYQQTKRSLENAIEDRSHRAARMKHAPKRMGNSEARLHKMTIRQKAGKVSNNARQLRNRLDRLEIKEKPQRETSYKMTTYTVDQTLSKTAIHVDHLSFAYDDTSVLYDISLDISRGQRVAITGDNGCGKTTLLNCIASQCDSITIAPNYSLGYFHQDCSNLDDNTDIIHNVMQRSQVPEHTARTILARLGIRRNEVYKSISVLSGGERCKVSLAMLICSRCNLLILDEPTNYLDIYVLEALENMLRSYDGTLIVVSHDRYFIDRVTDRRLIIENGCLIEPSDRVIESPVADQNNSRRLLLEYQKSQLVSRLSHPLNEQDKEAAAHDYEQVCMELQALSMQ